MSHNIHSVITLLIYEYPCSIVLRINQIALKCVFVFVRIVSVWAQEVSHWKLELVVFGQSWRDELCCSWPRVLGTLRARGSAAVYCAHTDNVIDCRYIETIKKHNADFIWLIKRVIIIECYEIVIIYCRYNYSNKI